MSAAKIYSTSSEAYRSREQAGEILASHLREYAGEKPVILGIPRGGVVIAGLVADLLDGEMDVVLTHKLGAPGNSELAIGAVSEDGHLIMDERLATITRASKEYVDHEKQQQLEVIRSRVEKYRAIKDKVDLTGRAVVITDDGIATGATMQAAVWAAKAEGAGKVIVAVPLAPADSLEELSHAADEIICVRSPVYFGSIGRFYDVFDQVSDEEVENILKTHAQRRK